MVSTPVKDPETGALLGLFLRSTSAETEAQRFLERYQEEFSSETPLLTGIFLEGQVYSRAVAPEIAALMSEVIAGRIARHSDLTTGDDLAFEADLGDVPYRFYVKPIGQDEGTATAFQVSAFSLAPLKADLAELRLRGSGVGGAALLIGIGIAWLFSRRLAIPIAELTRASRAVRDGQLETRINVRARDEIGELAESFNEMTEGLQQRDAYRGILSKVSDETVAQAMISGDLDLELGGELKTVSVLFCDIRGFTGQTEHMHPTEIIGLLNEHMTAMTTIVRKRYGVVDKFVGDEIMAVFGGLKSYGNDADHAVTCALEMIAERARLNQDAKHPIEVGIGVATGEAVAGCMGSVDRLNYTVIGARVNLASRLCSEAGVMEVVIDDQTLSCLEPERVGSEVIEDLRLKGFSGNVAAYRVREGIVVDALT
jgi:class 3 adenylate cyclase